MPLFEFEGRSPTVHPEAFVAPTAVLIGDVTVEAGASVWFNAVLRADYSPIVVREGANVQDGSVLHAPPGIPVDIGPGATAEVTGISRRRVTRLRVRLKKDAASAPHA